VTIFPEKGDDLVRPSGADLTREAKSIQVIGRFWLRMVILAVFAAFGSIGFARSLAALLGMSAVLSAVIAIIKREKMLGASLNHWDEMAIYVALACLLAGVDGYSVPS
jgi:hypothetical protein